jgi:hypothetical protein
VKALVLAAALLAGCTVHIHTGSDFPAALGVAVLAGALYMAEREGGTLDSRTPPELDPARKVNEQDCTKPVDWSAGNLRCK